MILERKIKYSGANWSEITRVRDLDLRSLDAHGVHGGRQIEVYKDAFNRTMAVGSEYIMGNGIIFKGFVPDKEGNWDYEYHIEEWYVRFEEQE